MPAPALQTKTPNAAQIICAHCGLPVPAARIAKDAEHQFCCAGCEAVWQIIHECSLDDFYRLRDQYDISRPVPAKISGKSFDYLDDPGYLQKFSEARVQGGFRVRFYLEGVHCIACSWLVEKVLLEREGARHAVLDLSRSVLEVVFNPAEIRLSAIARALDRLGYTPHPLWEGTGKAQRRETRSLLARLGIAAASAGNIMLLSVSQYAGDVTGIEAGFSALFRWVSLGLALPAVAYSAWPYYRGAWSGLRRGMLHMDLPISLGILASFAVSAAATIMNRGEVYFDSVSALIFLLLAGRLVLQRASRWVGDAAESLLSQTPRTTRRIESDGEREIILTEVNIGDLLRILPGETVPVDGVLESEQAWIRESHFSGEPASVSKRSGDLLFAGSSVENNPIDIRTTAVGETTRLARLAEMMRTASSRRAPIIRMLDRVAGWFVAAVLLLALATGLIWSYLDPSRAVWNVAALLVVACPCALGLATPVALAIAMGRAAKRGVFIKGQDGVERLTSANYVILDKTGTLTEGALSIVERHFAQGLNPDEAGKILAAAAALERYSGHVIAAAFQDQPASDIALDDCRVWPGAGIEGSVAGNKYCIGSEIFVSDRVEMIPQDLSQAARDAAERNHTLVWIARNRQAVAVLALGDRMREDAPAAIAELKRLNLSLELLSGDQPNAVKGVAERLGIENYAGRISPEKKLARVEELLAQGKRVAMVGDGVNDAAALAGATVGISAAGAAEVARDAADVFLAESREPSALSAAFRVSRHAMRIIRFNLIIAVAYNLIGVGLAVTGHVGPLVAAILMPLSSLTVLLIASRA